MNTHEKPTNKTHPKSPVDRQAVRVLAIEVGAREAARKLGLNENTVLGWAHRYNWKLPNRNSGPLAQAQSIKAQSTPGDALIATHKELEDATKTALMQTAAKAAQLAAQKPALDVTTTAQLRDLALTMARLCGWDGKPPASVTVNTAVQTGVVINGEQRMRLIAQRNRLLGLDEEGRKIEAAAPAPVPAQETQSSGQQERQGADTQSHAEPSRPLWWITVKPAEPEPEPEEGPAPRYGI